MPDLTPDTMFHVELWIYRDEDDFVSRFTWDLDARKTIKALRRYDRALGVFEGVDRLGSYNTVYIRNVNADVTTVLSATRVGS